MSLQLIHLRKLLRLLYSAPNTRMSLLRAEIRGDIAKDQGDDVGGADFYAPFWSDAKDHAVGRADLHEAVKQRVASNAARANLYPQLRDGFLLWWNERRRWTNAPFSQIQAPKGRYRFSDLNAVVKVENFLAVSDAVGANHLVYPYFSAAPVLHEEAGRLALWTIGRALPSVNWDEIRVLDVIRGQTFSVDRNPLQGNEEAVLMRRYEALLAQCERLRGEYQ